MSGVVISYVDPEVLFTVEPEGPGRWREPPYFEDLVRFATDGNVVGIKTYLRIGPQDLRGTAVSGGAGGMTDRIRMPRSF